ncbi:MAG: Type II secretion system F domain protein [Microgenomates group bacterium GW2011_GWA1_48_10]|uniref:Type II secretion system protein GspF domain-containing protein n=1 Tax=Candidatus Gottesmanbacteria bacterium RIFCSPHIGHO2_01_FULL_47_48 TaxID=1798381 RepID=A0A1F6A4S5_9BACT|nr:MAG: Type II secretion system F domain protein [Microgenomates group bacterium GW2011_GWA1_48_10]OGG19738.1 MAG: hypothetical protein A2721_01130 [Candidatus Gottesmanbacteria bacterium RIFCSPHIGHO2_01_FULL_47_48]
MKLSQITVFDRVNFIDILLFTKHLSVMIKAGIPLAEALEILRDQTQNPAFKKVLVTVSTEIRNGQSLTKTLALFPKIFNPFYLSLVSVGEQAGDLEVNLEYLATQLQKNYEFKKKVQGAMLYPSFVIVVALLMGSAMAIFVLPQLAGLFTSLDVDLPTSTRILIFVADLMKKHGLIIIPGLFAVFFLTTFLVKTPAVKPLWQRFLINLPIFGLFIKNVESANFCRSLGLMLKSGLTLSKALEIAREATDNTIFKEYIEGIEKAVDKGHTIESELSKKKYQHFPLIVSKMIGVGEKTGKLDETLLYLGDFFEEEVDSMAKNFPTILEPILLVIIALMVAFMALAIISPIYQFTASIHK